MSERLFYYVYFANCTDEEIQSLLNKYYAKEPLPLLGIIKICFLRLILFSTRMRSAGNDYDPVLEE